MSAPVVVPRVLLTQALGNEPFPWQLRLFEEFLKARVPRALDIPTGLGKTAVMAVWLVARAWGVASLPRRLVYVVDRRAVVDQATRVAMNLRDWVGTQPPGIKIRSLPISTLRGQFVDNREWLEDPSAMAIVVGTVDMIGSRVLFEGYACSRKMRPYHAGLLGSDTLFVLDEAHLVPPFERLMEAVADQSDLGPQREADRAIVPAARLMSLSATGRDHGDAAFRLDETDFGHAEVDKRIHAPKRIQLETLSKSDKLPELLAEHAYSLASAQDRPVRVIVFCHKRDDAEKAKQILDKRARTERGRKAELPASELFVGARRIRERTRAEASLQALGFLAGSQPGSDHAFLFATSAGEVGVDLDADHMVADVVAWERMVQRLGRVNRRGEGRAEAILLAHPDSEWVERVVPLLEHLPPAEGGGYDASPAALGDLRRDHAAAVAAATTPAPLHPALPRPLLEAWAMTSLREHAGRPEVEPWLRGWLDDDTNPPQTTVLWRTYLPPGGRDPSDPVVAAFFDAAPPHTSERLETSTHRVIAWLTSRAERISKRSKDATDSPPIAPGDIVAWVLDPAGEPEASLPIKHLLEHADARGRRRLHRQLAGRMVVVDARIGGLSLEGLLDEKEDALPPTGDVGAGDWLSGPSDQPAVRFRIVEHAANALPTDEGDWRARLQLPLETDGDGEVTRWLVIQKWRHDGATEDDRSAGPNQSLAEHQSWAEEEAQRLGEALELPPPYREALALAARLHDEGKRAERWQRAFKAPKDERAPYAKTRGPVNVRLLDGYRHELGSLPHALRDPALSALSEDMRELVLHLIASHHGHARPTIPTSGCDDAPPSLVEERAREIALRFVALQQRWGPWGLAWWESLLRAADQRASRRNENRHRNKETS